MRIIAGKYKRMPLKRVNKKTTRETADMVRESVFNMFKITADDIVLDLFAGSGSYGLEAISRGAKYAYLIDHDQDAISTIYDNVKLLNIMAQVTILKRDYKKFIKQLDSIVFNIVFLDPPYAMENYQEIISDLEKYVKNHGLIICESHKNYVFDDNILSFIKIKEKTYGIKKIAIYKKSS